MKLANFFAFFFDIIAFMSKKITNFALVTVFLASMQTTTTAIILGVQRYSDRASIVRAYTRACGRSNYIVYGLGSRRKGAGVYTPMSIVELTLKQDAGRELETIVDAQLAYVPKRMGTDIRRQTVAMFVAELLQNVLHHPLRDDGLFDMLMMIAVDLDQAEDIENVHLRCMVELAAHLGIGIDPDTHPQLVSVPEGRKARQAQLRALCDYFALHIDGWQPLYSLDVLSELFS